MGKVVVFNHPVMYEKLSIIRNELTDTKNFRQSIEEIATLMTYEATRDLPTKEVEVNVRNEQHLQIQLHNPAKIFKNKKKYTRKVKHRGKEF